MGVFRKDKNGNITKIASGVLIKRENTKFFMCTRSEEDGVEFFDIPDEAKEYYKGFEPNTIYNFAFDGNTTSTPQLRYDTTTLDIIDETTEDGTLEIGSLTGVFQMFTKTDEPGNIYFRAQSNESAGAIAVEINDEPGITEGTLSMSQLSTLQSNDLNYIIFDNELYTLQDKLHDTGYLVYSHVGHSNEDDFIIKCITINIYTSDWVLTEQKVASENYVDTKINQVIILALNTPV